MQSFTRLVKKALKYISKEKSMSIIYQSEEKPRVQMRKQKSRGVYRVYRTVLETEKDRTKSEQLKIDVPASLSHQNYKK